MSKRKFIEKPNKIVLFVIITCGRKVLRIYLVRTALIQVMRKCQVDNNCRTISHEYFDLFDVFDGMSNKCVNCFKK